MTKLNKEITFLSAGENKTLEFTISNRKECVIAKTVQEVANILIKYNSDSVFYCSSSMEFAKEYGFKTNDGADKMFDAGKKLAIKQYRKDA
jgi:hypothetical protein|tara:strand:- start:78 stop:350 length:273 start_codon:yes stop_codon:yes gene_type:complete